MKLSKLFVGIGLGALALGGTSALVIANSRESNSQPAVASAADGYTTYYAGDLGFATRDSNDTRIVLGDADHGEQAVGNVSLAAKSEQIFNFKRTRSNYWMGVGGYAVYVSSDTTIRFLYLGYSSSTYYSRNAEISNLVLKTADGATALTDVTGDNILFANYTTAVIRFDLSNPSAVKAHFHVIYNGVEYYTFNGSTMIDEVTYTHTCSGFAESYLDKAMCGYNGTTGGLSVIKFETYDNIKNLSNLFTGASAAVFSYSYIGDFYFGINISEQIFKKTGYLNDHLTDGTYKNKSGSNINLSDGLIINGKTIGEWVSFSDSGMTFPDNTGVHNFPMSVGGQFSPIAIEFAGTSFQFKIVHDYVTMDSLVITFKAGVFEGYNEDTNNTYKLSEDVTFYSTLEDTDSTGINSASTSVKIVRATNETVHTDYKITNLAYNGLKQNSHNYDYHQYTIWTNIPRNSMMTYGWTQDHYRYLYNNVLVNGKPVSWLNDWARGNSKDATDEYETKHATGSANPVFDMAVQLQIATDQTNFVMFIYIPVQLLTDLGLGTPEVTLRDASAWLTPSGVIRFNCTPEERYAVEAYVAENMHMDDYTVEQGYCADNEHHYYLTAKQAFNALSAGEQAAFQNASCFADAKDRYEAWARANGDANPYDGNNGISSSGILNPIKNNASSMIIVIAAAIAALSTLAAAFFIARKRKHN